MKTAEPSSDSGRAAPAERAERYDAILIGSGQAANPLAVDLAAAGWRVAVVEREHVGGTCINEGCTPTKTMIASGRAAYLARRGADFGVRTGPVAVDQVKVRQRKRDIVESFRSGSERSLRRDGIDLLMGEASFAGPRLVRVRLREGRTRHLTAERLFLNTGARPSRPPLPGLDDVPSFDSTTIMELDAVPDHLLVLGGGYVGLEFGQLFRRLGSRVTIVQRGPQLLAREDEDVATAVADVLRQDGIEVLLETEAVRVAPGPGGAGGPGGPSGSVALTVRPRRSGAGPDERPSDERPSDERPSDERSIEGSHLLVATGRRPNTEALNLEAAGIRTDDKGFVVADERLETSAPGVYALGDVKGGPAFTHISYDDYRVAARNLLGDGQGTTRGRLVPYTLFTDPQLGRVGLTEAEATRAGRKVKVAKMPMTSVARALEVDESRGLMKAVVDAETGQILGAAVLGIEGGELMALLEVAMLGHLPYTVLRDAIFAHPTLAESLNNLFYTFPE
jgi:pyruvate/2-oxoglutarate dehydrogenase complex dihydrolipoamide dehydrogenase (E3) component